MRAIVLTTEVFMDYGRQKSEMKEVVAVVGFLSHGTEEAQASGRRLIRLYFSPDVARGKRRVLSCELVGPPPLKVRFNFV